MRLFYMILAIYAGYQAGEAFWIGPRWYFVMQALFAYVFVCRWLEPFPRRRVVE